LPPNVAEAPEMEFNIDSLVPSHIPLPEALEKIEEMMIRRALNQSGYVQVRAAEFLGITKSLLQYKLKKYQITG
jgi:two-component system NtrC family response regulator